MLVEKQFQKIIDDLFIKDFTQIHLYEDDILIRLLEDASQVCFSSLVYQGEGYIPASVRKSLSRLSASPLTFFKIDEKQYQIHFYVLESEDIVEHEEHLHENFKRSLEEFSIQVQFWKTYLDDQDRNDRVFIHVKK